MGWTLAALKLTQAWEGLLTILIERFQLQTWPSSSLYMWIVIISHVWSVFFPYTNFHHLTHVYKSCVSLCVRVSTTSHHMYKSHCPIPLTGTLNKIKNKPVQRLKLKSNAQLAEKDRFSISWIEFVLCNDLTPGFEIYDLSHREWEWKRCWCWSSKARCNPLSKKDLWSRLHPRFP